MKNEDVFSDMIMVIVIGYHYRRVRLINGSMSEEDRLHLDEDILSYLRSCQSSAAVSRKDIQKQLVAKKKDIKHALKRLVKQNVIAKNGKKYTYIQQQTSSSSSMGSGDIVPIAQRMRTKDDNTHQQLQSESNKNKVDLDDEIKRLEAELAADSSNSESDDDIGDDDYESEVDDDTPNNNKKAISFGEDSIHKYDDGKQTTNSHEADIGGTGVICLSNVANDRIEPLPQSALPQNKRKMLKGIDSVDNDEKYNNKRSKKQKQQEKEEHKVSEGLKHAVQDLLQNYIRPSQIDRPPFYCRVCQHQSSSQSEFDEHRASEFHKVAVKEEQKKTYCKLCRKQLTSVVQMEEHLKSKPHRQKMDYVKNKQRGLIGGRDSGGRGGRGGPWQNGNGRGGGRGMQNGSSRRQWC